MLEQKDAIMNKVLEPIMFILVYPTVYMFWSTTLYFLGYVYVNTI